MTQQGFQWAENHKLGASQGGGPRGRAGEDSGSPGAPLLRCGKPVGGVWGWVRVQPGHTGFNSAGLLSLTARDSDYAVPPLPHDVTLKEGATLDITWLQSQTLATTTQKHRHYLCNIDAFNL